MYCFKGGTVQNCIIIRNAASGTFCDGGGVYCFEGGTVQNCIICRNTAYCGGGICCNFGGIVKDCIIKSNSATYGGGAYCYNVGLVQNCFICENSSGFDGGGVTCNSGGTVQNCIILENTAGWNGGGVHCFNGGLLVNCTICKNKSITQKTDGVFGEDKKPFIYNTIIYAHQNKGLWFELAFENYANRSRIVAARAINCWFGRPPGFVDIENNDLRLLRKSPCINRGTKNFKFSLTETDLAGNPRIMNGKIDIGAYEYNRNIFVKYKIIWNKSYKDKIILKSEFKNYKNLGENLSVKVNNSFIVSNLESFKVKEKVAIYKSDSPKCIAKVKVTPDGIIAKIKCMKLNKFDNVLNITNEKINVASRYIDVTYYFDTNTFSDKIFTKYTSKKDKLCKGQKP